MNAAFTPELVREALREVIDPEVGLNIVDLGLLCDVTADGGGIHVVMTMTTAACPLGPWIVEQAEDVLRRRFPEVPDIDVEITWSIPWDPSRISAEGRELLGLDPLTRTEEPR